eukprot:s1248_g5.t1
MVQDSVSVQSGMGWGRRVGGDVEISDELGRWTWSHGRDNAKVVLLEEISHKGQVGGGEDIIVNGSGEYSVPNVVLQTVELVRIESGVEITHKDRNIFRFVLGEKGMQLVPELLFTKEISRGILEGGWGVDGKQSEAVGTSVEDEDCNARIIGVEIVNDG